MNLKFFSLMIVSISLALPALADWYEGGDLHRKNGGDWRNASYANRLATSADFAAIAVGERTVRGYRSLDQLRPHATNIMRCIDEALADPATDRLAVSNAASACIVLLGYRPN